jgi:hypothetical protein
MKWDYLVAPQRREKQERVLSALLRGMGEHAGAMYTGKLLDPTAPFIGIGQMWAVDKVVPAALAAHRPFWLIDNGFYKPSGKFGGPGAAITGHYEFTYRGLCPISLKDPDYERHPAEAALKPWTYNPKGCVLIGHPGPSFGKLIGLDMQKWSRDIVARVQKFTNSRIVQRTKWSSIPLAGQLKDVRVVVTHSSNIAVDAIIAGIPAIVAPTNPAAPVCSTNLADIDNPPMPDRRDWWASLMCQQFTIKEMREGLAWHWMQRIMKQVDG